ncbi:TetR/AcrR family transcriptional regulator, partial [Mangrovimicrobium sediminis]
MTCAAALWYYAFIATDTATMNSPADPGKRPAEKPPAKRRYNSPLRQQQSAETRERIVLAGVDLVHGFTTWDWTNLTARAVSERAGVSERTVYRHFTSEKNLRDAVMQRLVSDSGIELGEMRIEDFPGITARMYQFLASFATVTQQPPQDPTFASMDEVRREALLDAVQRSLADWEPAEPRVVSAMPDLFWHPPAYERLL